MQSLFPTQSNFFTLTVRWAIVFALGGLLISMSTGQHGITNYIKLLQNKEELKSVSTQLAIENQLMRERIKTLRTSERAQVHFLKENFGYVEKGELVYLFKAPPGSTKVNQSAQNTPRRKDSI